MIFLTPDCYREPLYQLFLLCYAYIFVKKRSHSESLSDSETVQKCEILHHSEAQLKALLGEICEQAKRTQRRHK